MLLLIDVGNVETLRGEIHNSYFDREYPDRVFPAQTETVSSALCTLLREAEHLMDELTEGGGADEFGIDWAKVFAERVKYSAERIRREMES